MTTLRVPKNEQSIWSYGMATQFATGTGSVLYVGEGFDYSTVATLTIDADTGCTTETAASPFELSDGYAAISTVEAWPPRPF
jgi:hypothetical protein